MKRIKFLEQTSPTECGLCCLYMMLDYLGIKENFFRLRQKIVIGRNGLSLKDISNIAKSYGVEVKTYKIINDNIPHILPAMIFVENNHFVILESIVGDKYKIVDSAIGTYTLNKMEFYSMKPKYYTIFSCLEDFNGEGRKNKCTTNFKDVLEHGKKTIFWGCILTVLFQLFTIVTPFLIKSIIDNKNGWNNKIGYNNIIVIVISMIVFQCLIFYFKTIVLNIVQNNIHKNLSNIIVRKLTKLPIDNILRIDKSDVFHRYNGSMIARELFSERIVSIWLDILIMISSVIYIITISKFLCLILVIVLVFELLIYIFNISWKQDKLGKEILEQKKSLEHFFSFVNSLYVLKSHNVHEDMYLKWKNKFQRYIKANYERNKYFSLFVSINNFFNLLLPILVVIYCIYFTSNNSGGDIMLAYLMTVNFIGPLNKVLSSIDEVLYGFKYYERVVEIKELKEEINGSYCLSKDKRLNISLKNVSYKYEYNSEYVLKDITLDVKDGEFISIIGKSGCGKSSLAKVLLGYIEPTNGTIEYNSINYNDINKKDFREISSLILQDNPILDGSINYNITLNRKNIKKNRIIEICKNVDIYNDIDRMLMGFDTQLQRENINLSGGQKQRISLAREIINNPKLLVLDEPTSALDILTEQIIQKNIETLNCTRILITHRLNTIIKSDRIIVMEDGKIIDIGTHEELYTRSNYYKNMYDLYMNNMKGK